MDPFIGEIVMFGGNFAPRGWALCEGQLLPISQNSALFSILGTTYGGDGRTTFALPDLRGRAPIQQGNGPGLPDYRLGQKGGRENVTLTVNELPSHNHGVQIHVSEEDANTDDPSGAYPAITPANAYETTKSSTTLGAPTVTNTGNSRSFSIMQPYIAINYIIALQGVFPSRS